MSYITGRWFCQIAGLVSHHDISQFSKLQSILMQFSIKVFKTVQLLQFFFAFLYNKMSEFKGIKCDLCIIFRIFLLTSISY